MKLGGTYTLGLLLPPYHSHSGRAWERESLCGRTRYTLGAPLPSTPSGHRLPGSCRVSIVSPPPNTTQGGHPNLHWRSSSVLIPLFLSTSRFPLFLFRYFYPPPVFFYSCSFLFIHLPFSSILTPFFLSTSHFLLCFLHSLLLTVSLFPITCPSNPVYQLF